jgi:hypothetical protein
MPLAPTVEWPTLEDFYAYLGQNYQGPGTDSAVRAAEAFPAADGVVKEALEEASLTADPDNPGQYLCPGPVRQAILLLANRYFARRDAWAGAAGFGDSALRLARTDPDVYGMLSAWTGGYEP